MESPQEVEVSDGFSVRIDELTFSGGERVRPEESSLLILIGPNNCGKSTALRETREHFGKAHQNRDEEWKVVMDMSVSHSESRDSLTSWIESRFTSSDQNGQRHYHALEGKGGSFSLNERLIRQQPVAHAFSRAKDFYVHLLDTGSRLNLVNPPKRINVHNKPHTHYIHELQADDELLAEVSARVREAFRRDLIPNWGGGQNVPLHVGEEPQIEGADRVSSDYLRALAEEPRLDKEGDGIKSFVGCLLAVRCAPHEILLIDEPEAFLHPPQARRLGRILAESAGEENRQVVAATHSSDVVRGAISSGSNVSICRLNREGNTNHASQLPSDELKDLWAKPLLKSSGAVEGIFHRGVVVCEGDSDARFYESLLMRLEEDDALDEPADLHFIHGGSKGELPYLIESYERLNVPVVAIADFDILRSRQDLRRTVDALGGDFSQIEGLYNSVSSALAEVAPSEGLAEALEEVRDRLSSIEDSGSVSGADRNEISRLLDDARDWSEAKKYGLTKLRGGVHQDCEKLLQQLKAKGLFVVPSGEMESWDRGLPASKREWIKQALNKIDADSSAFRDAKDFIVEAGSHLGIATA